jgi:hypothetical protein
MTQEFKKLDDNVIIRWRDGEKYFGWRKTALKAKIRTGEIPRPYPAGPDGRASFWYGWQVNRHNEKILANAEEWEAARKAKRSAQALEREARKREAKTKRGRNDKSLA